MASKPLLTIFMFSSTFMSTLTLMPTPIYSLPFVVFHGAAEKCSNGPVRRFTELLSNWSDSQGYCIEIGNGVWDSWFMPFTEQTNIACEKVKEISELSKGYNIVGLSQGNIVGRGVLEFCDGGPPVKNFISLAGPHAGIASVPFCGSGLLCILVDFLLQLAVYCDYVQEHFAPAGYIKIPTDIGDYLKGCRFLPKLNNEIVRNSSYKKRFASLHNLILIMFEQDTVLVPKETSWFGYYSDGSWSTVLPAQKTNLYTEDWIGLKVLDEAGKVKFINVSGGHLEISQNDIKKYIVPYLEDEESTKSRMADSSRIGLSSTKSRMVYSSRIRLSSIKSRMADSSRRLSSTKLRMVDSYRIQLSSTKSKMVDSSCTRLSSTKSRMVDSSRIRLSCLWNFIEELLRLTNKDILLHILD